MRGADHDHDQDPVHGQGLDLDPDQALVLVLGQALVLVQPRVPVLVMNLVSTRKWARRSMLEKRQTTAESVGPNQGTLY